jgi:hypothetical protein
VRVTHVQLLPLPPPLQIHNTQRRARARAGIVGKDLTAESERNLSALASRIREIYFIWERGAGNTIRPDARARIVGTLVASRCVHSEKRDREKCSLRNSSSRHQNKQIEALCRPPLACMRKPNCVFRHWVTRVSRRKIYTF